MGKFIIEFDYRSDGGSDRVGPFNSRDEADAWLAATPIETCEYSIVPLDEPKVVRHNIFDNPSSMGD